MIKYTGYGNAAGLFAKRGLLGNKDREKEQLYSSDSEDSDTEEYKKHQHGINPIIGCYEPPKTNVLEGMTEEQVKTNSYKFASYIDEIFNLQKEYEAEKLVNLIDQLHRQGIVKPCKIGEDGKPVPVEHVLELQKEMEEHLDP